MKTLFTLFFLTIRLISYSQNLTLEELLALRKKDLPTAEEYLTMKKWQFISSSNQNNVFYKGSFAYNKNSFDDSAESFISLYTSEQPKRNRLDIQIHKTEKYNSYITRIKVLGCKLIDSKIEYDEIKKIYQGATTTFIITTSTVEDEVYTATSTVYHIFILENVEYELYFTE